MLYLWLATIFGYTSPDLALSGATLTNSFFKIGGFGNSFANFNRGMFGYVSYIYLPLLLLPIYRLHDDTSYSFRKIQLTFAYLLLFVGMLMLQSLIFHSGQFGNYLQSLLVPYIGLFGFAILTFIVISISLLLIAERTATFLFQYLGGTLQMALQSLSTILKKAFDKVKYKYSDLSLDYIQRANKKMVNQELSERATTTKSKFVDDEPLIERPLDEYNFNQENLLQQDLENNHTKAQISQINIENNTESNQSEMQSNTTKQDSKDSFNIQVRPNTTQTQSTLSYQQYNERDINTISHTPRTQIRNNEEDLLKRFQKANPYPKQNQQPHTSYADEPMTFRIKPDTSETNPLESFAKTKNPKTLPTIDDWWLTDKPLQRETKTTNLIKSKTKDSIQISNKTAESFTIKEVATPNTEALPQEITAEVSIMKQAQDSTKKDSEIQIKPIQDSKQSINNTTEMQNYEIENKQTQWQINSQEKNQTQQMPLHASYKTLDMSFTQKDINQTSKDSQYLEQKDSIQKDLIQSRNTQTTQNLNTEQINIDDTIEQIEQNIYDEKENLEQAPREVAADSMESIESITIKEGLQDTFTENMTDNPVLVAPLDSMDLTNNSTIDDTIESISTITIPPLYDETTSDMAINDMPEELRLNTDTEKENDMESKDSTISNDILKEDRDFDITENIQEQDNQTMQKQEVIITIKPAQNQDDYTIYKQDSMQQNPQIQDINLANNTYKDSNNTESKEINNLQSTQIELQNDLQSNLAHTNSQTKEKQNTQEFTIKLDVSMEQDSITNPYITTINHTPHTITQASYTQPPIHTNLHYPTNMQAQNYDFNIKSQQGMQTHYKHDYNIKENFNQSYPSMQQTNTQNLALQKENDIYANSNTNKDSINDNKILIKDYTQPNNDLTKQSFIESNQQEKIFQEKTITESINPEDMIIRQIAQKKEEAKQESNMLLASHDTNIVKNTQKEDLPPFILPPLKLLQEPVEQDSIQDIELDSKIEKMLQIFNAHKIRGDIIDTLTGPVVTTFEFRPETHVKVSKILSHRNDLARILKAKSIRIQAPIPGKDVIGIQIPNSKVETIYLREILQSDAFLESKDMLTIALGKDISGMPIVANLAKLPHLLVAGTTGSGKSVGVNAIILSLLYRNDPDSLKLMMIDPKQVEFAPYEDLPHLITPIINAPNKAIKALQVATIEMDKRYELFSQIKVKNIASYNEKVSVKMPNFVIIIDELADLMITGGKEAEAFIARIAQMGRAAGMHLIIATQRSSVNVITGHIKANLPSRISYRVGSRIDSKVILDEMGAEDLLGNGDGLFTTTNGLMRIHAPWVSEQEVEHIVDFIKAQREPQYDENFLSETKPGAIASDKFSGDGSLIDKAKEVILQDNKTSISYLQRKLGIGYNKSASLIEALEQEGFLSAPNSKGERSIL